MAALPGAVGEQPPSHELMQVDDPTLPVLSLESDKQLDAGDEIHVFEHHSRPAASQQLRTPVWVKALRVVVPVLVIALWFVLLWVACFGHTHARVVPTSEVSLTVGCAPAAETAACPVDTGVLTVAPAEFAPLLAPALHTGTVADQTDAIFHWRVDASSRNRTCQEEHLGVFRIEGSRSKACVDGSVSCTVHYIVGEIELFMSPAWFYASSLGLLETSEHALHLTLVDGWDQCLPLPAQSDRTPVDVLVHWLMSEAGVEIGYLASDSDDSTSTWAALDLSTCEIGLSPKDGKTCERQPYTPSKRMIWCAVTYSLAQLVLVAILLASCRAVDSISEPDSGAEIAVRLVLPSLPVVKSSGVAQKRAERVTHEIRTRLQKQFMSKVLQANQTELKRSNRTALTASLNSTEETSVAEGTRAELQSRFWENPQHVVTYKQWQRSVEAARKAFPGRIFKSAEEQLGFRDFVEIMKPHLLRIDDEREEAGEMPRADCSRPRAVSLELCNKGCYAVFCCRCTRSGDTGGPELLSFESELCADIWGELLREEHDEDADATFAVSRVLKFICTFDGEESDSESESDTADTDKIKTDEKQQLLVDFAVQDAERHELSTYPTCFNSLADQVVGVTDPKRRRLSRKPERCSTALLAGLLQGSMVLPPVLGSIIFQWLRNAASSRAQHLYFLESLPIWNESHSQTLTFVVGAVYLVASALDNLAYSWVWYASVERPGSSGVVNSCKPVSWRQLRWAFKAATSWLQKTMLVVQMIMTTFLLVSFVLCLLVALVLDPYKPLASLLALATLIFVVSTFLSTALATRRKLRKAIQRQYLLTHQGELGTKKDKIVSQLKELISEELERMGLSLGSIFVWTVIVIICVGAIIALVLIAQTLFSPAWGTSGVQGLVSTAATCAAVVGQGLRNLMASKNALNTKLGNVESIVIQHARKAKQLQHARIKKLELS